MIIDKKAYCIFLLEYLEYALDLFRFFVYVLRSVFEGDSLTKRIVSGLICIALLVTVMFLSATWSFSLNLAVAIVSCISIFEILCLKGESKRGIFFISSILFSSARSLFGPGTKWKISLYLYAIFCLIIAMMRFVKNKKKNPSEQESVWNVCFVFFLNVVVSISLGTIVEIRNFGKSFGIFLSLLSLGIAWSCDMGAYFCGKFFGKNKMCPQVSPKKTIEGAIGGVVSSLIYSFTLCICSQYLFKIQGINYFNVFLLSVIGAPIAILGDLCFSLIKRLLSIKDFGNIIPGHGGVLDRFDSVIFVSPFVLIFLHIFNIVG